MEIFENLSVSSRLGREELDTYSRAVREVTEKLEPAVISVGAASGRGGGSGGHRMIPGILSGSGKEDLYIGKVLGMHVAQLMLS